MNTPLSPLPLSLYVHIPWCVRKCPYCDFNSHQQPEQLPEKEYIHALLADLNNEVAHAQGRPLISIFIGGGTPSLLSGTAIGTLLDGVAKHFTLADDIEITLEANPGTVEHGNFADYQRAGVNRISLGAQSFQDDKLARLGRIHCAQEAIHAIEKIRRAGIDNINIDLMFGLPEQRVDDALSDLNTAISLAPTHLSWYELTLEPNTLFYHQPPPLPPDDTLAAMQAAGQALLADTGFQHYEVSAFSQAERTCRHNCNYWEFGDYLGVGAGAHGKITHPSGDITRYWKKRSPKDYLAAYHTGEHDFIMGNTTPDAAALQFEFMLNALRLQMPIPLALFEARTGLPSSCLHDPLSRAQAQGLLTWDTEIRPTPVGRRFLNDIINFF